MDSLLEDLDEISESEFSFNNTGNEEQSHNTYVLDKNLEVIKLAIAEKTINLELISKYRNLEELSLEECLIYQVPESFKNLTKLKKLSLHDNSLSKVPNFIQYLSNLEELYLGMNKITQIPNFIGNSTNLKKIMLFNNKITRVPDFIGDLTNLRELSLSGNYITKIPESFKNLTNLTRLDLDKNIIDKNITKESKKLHPQELINYLLSIQDKQNNQPLKEAKILVVGEERVGKTSVINRLTKNPFDRGQDSTIGIDILNYDLSNGIKVNIWDFAGQEITQQTHQFFLSSRSLYLYVIDSQKEDDDSSIFHWLTVIKSNAEDSPIIIIVNQRDKNQSYKFDVNRYDQEFNIVDVLYISCEDDDKIKPNIRPLIEHSIEDLINTVEKNIESLDGVNKPLNKDWFSVKEELEDLNSQDKDFIEMNTFEDICCKHKVSDEADQRSLLGILDAIGTVVSFVDNHKLENMHIINPMWVTNGVYKIIRSPLLNGNALLSEDDFREIFRDDTRYKKRHYRWIINLLSQFEISFELEKQKDEITRILIPSKLEPNQPVFDFKFYQIGLNFLYEYTNILKKGIISQFIVKMHMYIDKELDIPYWQRGVFFEYNGSKAVVISDEDKKTITIAINTNDSYGKELLNIIRHNLRVINGKKLNANELVPLILDNQIVGYEDYEYLIDDEAKGETDIKLKVEIDGKKVRHQFSLKKILDGYKYKDKYGYNYEKLKIDLINISQIEINSIKEKADKHEDILSDVFVKALEHRSYNAYDQSLILTDNLRGERDIVIKENGIEKSIIEALKLNSCVKESINSHYEKLCDKYDSLGLVLKFVVVYSSAKNFNKFWDNYKKHFGNELNTHFEDTHKKYSDSEKVKVGYTKHNSSSIYHIVIDTL